MREIVPTLKAGLSMADPALLRALGAVHRRQETRIFASEGAEGARGRWDPLNERYAKRKTKAVGRRKILVFSNDMKDRFIKAENPGYVQEFIPTSEALGLFRFGARSDVAAAHLRGNPALALRQSALARKVFGGRAPRLPVRDMVTKTQAHLAELRERLRTWYIARLKQQIRGRSALGVR